MKIIARVSLVLILVLIGVGIGWRLKTSRQLGHPQAKHGIFPCGDANPQVYKDGVHLHDELILVCEGDLVEWQLQKNEVKNVTIHFDSSPFDHRHGAGDYPAGDDYPPHQNGTGQLKATYDPSNLFYHYSVTVTPRVGSPKSYDPHVIVAGTGRPN